MRKDNDDGDGEVDVIVICAVRVFNFFCESVMFQSGDICRLI